MKTTKYLLLNTMFFAATIFVPRADAFTAAHHWTATTLHPFASVGYASYYSNYYNGRKTANGERFSNSEYTAASNDLPLGSRVRVTNLKNRRSVVVRVTDRGPYAKGRAIDLTLRAAEDIGMLRSGVAKVRITRLS
jgi:rare lipoprotein A